MTRKGSLFVKKALAKVGKPYSNDPNNPTAIGAAGPNAYDCSGLVEVCAREVDPTLVLPHLASAQMAMFPAVTKRRMRSGDLIFFHGGAHVVIVKCYNWRRRCWIVVDSEPGTEYTPWRTFKPIGVQRRPMLPGYYIGWANVSKIARIVRINGAP
jgi:hypothetical protein